MFSSSFDQEILLQRKLLFVQDNATMSHIFLLTLVAWAVWRFWKFTLYPKLHPDEPLELPYSIPCKSYNPAKHLMSIH